MRVLIFYFVCCDQFCALWQPASANYIFNIGEMDIYGFLGPAVFAILFITSLIFQESIKQIIKRYFSKISRKKLDRLFYVILLIIGIIIIPFSFNYIPSFERAENVEEKVPLSNEKSKEEIYVEAGMAAVEEVQKALEQKKRNDSARVANKKPTWVYQIGRPKTHVQELWEAYEPLQGLSNLYVFKESKKSYIIIKDDGYSKQQLEESLEAFESEVEKFETRIHIVNLSTFCKAKEDIKQGKKIKIRKQRIMLSSIECN